MLLRDIYSLIMYGNNFSKSLNMEDLQKAEEEIFCLKYELDTLSGVLLRQKAERWIPDFIDERTNKEHWDRYELACQYAKGKTILDIACGVGRGSYLLATMGEAKSVTACDIQDMAIRYASFRNKHENISFSVQDAEIYKQPGMFDLVVSFETIEHLKNYEAFLQNIYESLKHKGTFIVSTPVAHVNVDTNPINPYHIQEWGFEKFHEIISKRFTIKKVFTQLVRYIPPTPFEKRMMKAIGRRLGLKDNKPILNADTGRSILEEFKNQYDIKEMGKFLIGYQTVICEKA
jgi:SAM-dependent methyltransferase